jgi:dTDP-glucose 4,6-dehydratase
MREIKNILVTGGSGFIGSNFIHYLFEDLNFKGTVVNLDKLTYAGNPDNLKFIETNFKDRYFFEKADICDCDKVKETIEKYNIDTVVHFAAESHVDNSIKGPAPFIETNINGTFSLLEAVKSFQDKRQIHFHHVSTDEVYGSLGKIGYFTEKSPYNPRSPYSASKAASDHLVRAYFHTYKVSVTISNCSNNYGPYQFPEKLIPVVLLNILNKTDIPIYGDGKNIRDWLFVKDHCRAIFEIVKKGKTGDTYNIGGNCEVENIILVEKLCEIADNLLKRMKGSSKKLITFVKDRPGHDRRYAIDCTKLKNELNIEPSTDFETGLEYTVNWYFNNLEWVENIKSGKYRRKQ